MESDGGLRSEKARGEVSIPSCGQVRVAQDIESRWDPDQVEIKLLSLFFPGRGVTCPEPPGQADLPRGSSTSSALREA